MMVTGGDFWWWHAENKGVYSVSPPYNTLLEDVLHLYFSLIWRDCALSSILVTWVSSKVVVFSWKLILDKFPSRVNLVKRILFLEDVGVTCSFCWRATWSNSHLFINCDFTLSLWYNIFRWMRWSSLFIKIYYLVWVLWCFRPVR